MKSIVMLSAVLIASAAPAQPPARPAEPGDPNETICRRENVIGSRLAVARLCLTRAQWVARRRASRVMIEEAQLRQVNPMSRDPATMAAATGRGPGPQ